MHHHLPHPCTMTSPTFVLAFPSPSCPPLSPPPQMRARLQRHQYDPDHYIVNGAGGAFLHPTHIFAAARFSTVPDPAAEATAALYSNIQEPCTCRWGGGEGVHFATCSAGTQTNPKPYNPTTLNPTTLQPYNPKP